MRWILVGQKIVEEFENWPYADKGRWKTIEEGNQRRWRGDAAEIRKTEEWRRNLTLGSTGHRFALPVIRALGLQERQRSSYEYRK